MLASDDELDGDSQEFDCQTCALADGLEGLDADNLHAWRLFNQVVSRLAMDVPGLAGAILARVVADETGEDAADLFQRLSVIYDTLHPPPPSK